MAGPLRARTRTAPSSTRRWTDIELDAVVDVGRSVTTRATRASRSPISRAPARPRRRRGLRRGLATDYCVRASAIDACREGFDVTVVEDAVRAVEVNPGDSERAFQDMRDAGARIASSAEVLAGAEAG